MNEVAATTLASDETALPKNDKLKWYVVHTYSGFENKAKASLEDRIKQQNLVERFGEILIPVEMVEEVKTEEKGGKTVTTRRQVKRKFAPGYIFVQMEMNPETWQCVKNTPKVTGFIGAPNQKSGNTETDLKRIPSVPEKQVLAMAALLTDTAVKPAPRIDFDVGENVRVVEGNFINFNGSVAEVNHGKQKVKVNITIFGRSQPVEFDFSQVAKVG
jgi:transcriptional antiterminator NusG